MGPQPQPQEPTHHRELTPEQIEGNKRRSLFTRSRISPAAVFPGVMALRGYQRGWLRGDVLAGLTVTAYVVPQVMAYAQVAGLPPAVGLFAVIGPALAYALFGSSRRLSAGPESTTALMAASVVGAAIGVGGEADPGKVVAFAAALAVVVGVLCVVGWVSGLGFLADLLSKPVLIGYMAGAAVLMMVGQIEKTTGIPTHGDSLPQQLISAFAAATEHVHWPTVVLSVSLIFLLVVATKVMPKAPNALFAVLLATIATGVFHLQELGLKTVGAIPNSFPTPQLPALTWHSISEMLIPALGIVVVGYSDNILTARAFARRGDPPIDANQEFLALGMANIGAGMMGGLPVSSSGSRTALAGLVGAKTQAYMLVTAAGVAAVVLFLGPLLAMFPKAALGAVVVFAATRLIEWEEIKRIARFRTSELVLMVTTTVGVFFLGVLGGIGLAVALSLGDLLRRVVRPRDAVLGYVPGVGGMHDVNDHPIAHQVPGLVVYRYDSPLFFANAEDFRQRALLAVNEAPSKTLWLVLNAEANVETDVTSLDALHALSEELTERGIVLGLARVKQEVLEDLTEHDPEGIFASDRVFATLPEAVRAYLAWHEEKFGSLPEGVEDLPLISQPARLEATETGSQGAAHGSQDPENGPRAVKTD